MWSLNVVGGWYIYLVMSNASFYSCHYFVSTLWQPHPYFLFNVIVVNPRHARAERGYSSCLVCVYVCLSAHAILAVAQ